VIRMLSLIPAKKLGMTSVFDEAGTTIPATVLEPYDVYVVRKKSMHRDGYSALVLGYSERAEKHITKPVKGQLLKAGISSNLSRFYEIKLPEEEAANLEAGQRLEPSSFLKYWGEVAATGISKGKGFQGVMKRHNFRGIRMTHGQTIHRKPASNNATDPARVFKGSRRPGRMGNEKVTVKNLSVFEYDRLHNIIVLSGTVPGAKGGLVWVKMTKELDKAIVDQQDVVYEEAVAEEARIAAELGEELVSAPVEEPSEPIGESESSEEAGKSPKEEGVD